MTRDSGLKVNSVEFEFALDLMLDGLENLMDRP
jgi:hypothetical protein